MMETNCTDRISACMIVIITQLNHVLEGHNEFLVMQWLSLVGVAKLSMYMSGRFSPVSIVNCEIQIVQLK